MTGLDVGSDLYPYQEFFHIRLSRRLEISDSAV